MLSLLNDDAELYVESGFLYLPLLLDPDIAEEVRLRWDLRTSSAAGPGQQPGMVAEAEGRTFVRSLSLSSLTVNFEAIDPEYCERLKRECFGAQENRPDLSPLSSHSKLRTIVLKVMPHFVRKARGLVRRPLSDDEFMDFLCSRIEIPRELMHRAEAILAPEPIARRLDETLLMDETAVPMPTGRTSGGELRRWLRAALKQHILAHERSRLQRELLERERLSQTRQKHVAMMLYLADRGSFELDGFGFQRIGSREEYFIYKRTGAYILKDYYDQSYHFPDCRVAVSTAGPLRPLVLESYKHPFLLSHLSKQEICMSGYDWPHEFSSDTVIRLLEDGINALLYGYDPRRRNGYHSLDRTLYYVKGIDFEDYRTGQDGDRGECRTPLSPGPQGAGIP